MARASGPPTLAGDLAPHAVDARNPDRCTPDHACGGHAKGHVHGPGCGHPAISHGEHTCFVVDGHLHHPHGDHCDDHGPVRAGPPGGSAIGGP
jgi:hypothetical protein